MFDEKRRQQDHYEATMAQIYYEHELALEERGKKGVEQGRIEGTEQLILTMLKKGADAQTIAELTDISEGKIKEIANKNMV